MNTKSAEKKYIKSSIIIIIIVLLLVASVSILIYFYFKPITKKVLVEEKGYMFSEGNMEPVLCDLKFQGYFAKYLFSNKRTFLNGTIYVNDTYLDIGEWTFFHGYGTGNIIPNQSICINEEYDGFLLNIYIDYNRDSRVPWQPNAENKRLIIAPVQNMEGVLLDWKNYTQESYFILEHKNMDPWQLDILNNPDKYFTE